MLKPGNLYSPPHQTILASFVGGGGGSLNYEDAIDEAGLPDICADDPALAAAAVILSGIQNRLPQWGVYDGSEVNLSREASSSSVDTIGVVPTLVCVVNWATTGPGYSWPIAYHLTYLPVFDVEVLTASADTPELFRGMCDIAITCSPTQPNRRHLAIELIAQCWEDQIATFGSNWEAVDVSGLVDRLTAFEILRVNQEYLDDEIPSPATIGDQALAIFTRSELQTLSAARLHSLAATLRLRLTNSAKPLSKKEQDGLRCSILGHEYPSSVRFKPNPRANVLAIKGDAK